MASDGFGRSDGGVSGGGGTASDRLSVGGQTFPGGRPVSMGIGAGR